MSRFLLIAAVFSLTVLQAITPWSSAHADIPAIGPDDVVLGKPDAAVTVVEYASLTCPHCAQWENDVFPQVKTNWIDTGKIRFVFRDFPLDGIALHAAILAHCAGTDHYVGFIQVLFRSQQSWAHVANPLDELAKIGRLGGVPDPKFQACQADPSLQNSVVMSREHAADAGVDSTPTFFINGKKLPGEIAYDQFVKLLQDAGAQ